MSGFSNVPTPDPGAHDNAPWDFATFLQKTAAQRQIYQGPGGTTVVLDKDSLFGPPPSDEGIGGTKEKVHVKTNDPKLDEPGFAGLGLWSMQFASTIISVLIGSMKDSPKVGSNLQADESLATTLAYREEALFQALVEEGLISPDTVSGTFKFGSTTPLGGKDGVVDGHVDINEGNVNAAYIAWYESLAKTMSTNLPILSSANKALLNDIGSTDVETIKQRLVGMANLPSLHLTPAQETAFLIRLDTLAQAIRGANQRGGAFVLNMTVPGLMIQVFMETVHMSTDTTLTADDKEKLSLALMNICNDLATANLQNAISLKAPSPEFLALISGDPQKISSLLVAITSTMTLPPGVTSKDLTGALNAITTFLCSLSDEKLETLQSIDLAGLTALFSQGLDAAQAAGTISSEVKAQLLTTLVPLLANHTKAINEVKLKGDLSSKDPATIKRSLTFLTEVNSDKEVSEPTRLVVMTYIQALISALVYLANIRCLMLQMETEFTQTLGTAKISTIMEQLKVAESTYTTALHKVTTTYESNIASIDKARFWKWFGPLLMVLVVVIMTILIIISAVATALSGGAAAPILMGTIVATIKLILLCVAVAAAVLAMILVLADAICQWTSGKSMWKMIGESMGVKGELETAAIAAAFDILLNIIVIIGTFGAASAMIAAKQAIAEGVKATLKEVLRRMAEMMIKELAKNSGKYVFDEVAKTLTRRLVESILTAIMTTGFLDQVVKAIGKAAIHDEKKAAAFITAMTIVLTIICMAVMIKVGGLSKALRKGTAKPTAKGVVMGAHRAAAAAARAAAQGAGAANVGEKMARMLKNFDKYLGKLNDEFIKMFDSWKNSMWATMKSPFARPESALAAVKGTGTVAKQAGQYSLTNIFRNIFAHYKEVLALGKGAQGLSGMEKALLRMGFVRDMLRLAQFCLQLTAAIMQYRAAEKEKEIHELLAALSEEQANLQAIAHYLGSLGGIDQTETISKITEVAGEAFENWTRLLELVSDFIKDAGARISEMTSRGGA